MKICINTNPARQASHTLLHPTALENLVLYPSFRNNIHRACGGREGRAGSPTKALLIPEWGLVWAPSPPRHQVPGNLLKTKSHEDELLGFCLEMADPNMADPPPPIPAGFPLQQSPTVQRPTSFKKSKPRQHRWPRSFKSPGPSPGQSFHLRPLPPHRACRSCPADVQRAQSSV